MNTYFCPTTKVFVAETDLTQMVPIDDSQIELIDQLNGQAWLVRLTDVNASLSYSGQALALAEQLSYEKGMAEALRTTGFCNIRLSKHQEATVYLTKALQIFQKIGHLRGQAHVHEYFGLIHRSLGDYEASLVSLFKALRIQQQESDQEGESLTNYHIGITYKYLGNLEQALEYLLEGLFLAQAINYGVTESYALNHLGVIYADMGNFPNALEYYEQSLNIRSNLGDKWGEAGCLDNIGLIHYKVGQFEKGVQYCSESLAITQKIGDKKGEGNSYFHLGLLYNQIGEDEKAYHCANQSLQVRMEIGDKRGQIETLLLLNELLGIDDLKKAEGLLHEAANIGQEIQAKDLLFQIHLQQYKFYKEIGALEKALFHLETQQQLEKELYNQSLNQKLINQKTNHQIEQAKKEAENLAIKAELKLLSDRQRIARDLHDDVGSLLSSISILSESFLRHVQTDLDKARFSNLGDKARTALESISDIVWSVNPDNDPTDKLLARMINYAAEMMENVGTALFFHADEAVASLVLPIDQRKDFYLIFKEAIHNCAKYAHASSLRIALKIENDLLKMTIRDDGVGFDTTKVSHAGVGGNGLKNIQQRAQAIRGDFSIQSTPGEGTSLYLAVPLVP